MADPSRGASCLREACKAAKRRDQSALDRKLKELSSMDLKVPDNSLERWIDQIVRDEGFRLGRDLYISTPPTFKGEGAKSIYGLGLKFRF